MRRNQGGATTASKAPTSSPRADQGGAGIDSGAQGHVAIVGPSLLRSGKLWLTQPSLLR